MFTIFIILVLSSQVCAGSRILVISPSPSYSHQITLQPIWKALALRGHDVVVLTTSPLQDTTLPNLKEIDLSFAEDIWKRAMFQISGGSNILSDLYVMYFTVNEILESELKHPEVQSLMRNESEYFDVALVEYMHATMFAFPKRFKCPFIGVSSMEMPGHLHEIIGNARHAAAYPDSFLNLPEETNVFHRMAALFASHIFQWVWHYVFAMGDRQLIVKYFGEDYPSVSELANSVDMIFVSSNPVFHNVRPMGPATVVISGGIHIKEPKPLPEDLQNYFNNSKRGVIYFSLGSNVMSKNIPAETKNVIMETFSELPYDILMKYEDENLLEKPKNVRTIQWAPQQDILRHPNVKLFITQGGMQSLEEALYNYIPLICVPFFADQHFNAQKVVDRGIGLSLDYKTMTKAEFKEKILEVIKNEKYKNKVKKLADLVKDEPMTAIEKAVWWTEYVIRHKGAKHLRTKNIPYYQYYYLDVMAVLAIIFTLIYSLIKQCIKYICKRKHKTE